MKLSEVENMGFKVDSAPRIDLAPRKMMEVHLYDEKGKVSMLCTQEAFDNRLEQLYDTLLSRYNAEVSPIPSFGRGCVRLKGSYNKYVSY